jgi:hypothetical protein
VDPRGRPHIQTDTQWRPRLLLLRARRDRLPVSGIRCLHRQHREAARVCALSVSAADVATNATGFVKMVNWGDQPMATRFTCVGPGTFYSGTAPTPPSRHIRAAGANQMAQVVTDARKRGVVDLSVQPVTTVGAEPAGSGLTDLLGFANLVGGLIQALTGLLGRRAPHCYRRATCTPCYRDDSPGRHTFHPSRSGAPPKGYHIPVTIEGGNG